VWIETLCCNLQVFCQDQVTPHAGVWIETHFYCTIWNSYKSRLMQACGLKLLNAYRFDFAGFVTPHAGVWIETFV